MNAFFELDREINDTLCVARLKNNRIAPHFHSHIEIICVLNGEITVSINGNTQKLKKDDISIAINFAIHSYMTEDFSEIIVLVIPIEMLKSFLKVIENKDFSQPFLLSHPISKEILFCMEKISNNQFQGNSLKIKGYLYIILSHLIDSLKLCEINKKQSYFPPREVLIYMQNNILNNISLKDVANAFGYSKYYFSRFLIRILSVVLMNI
jgi:hypothetical protein